MKGYGEDMRTIINMNMRKKFIAHMNSCVESGLLTNIDMIMQFYDKDIVLKGKDGRVLLNNNHARTRLLMLHVYDDVNDSNLVYVLQQQGNKYSIQQILETKELYRSVVTRTFEYEVAQELYKAV